jgi:hypothetical protein
MKRILNAYYELTVIPAIVLGCATALLHPIFNYMAIGASNLPTIGEAIGVTILFLVPMTIEHVWDALHRVG